MSDVLQALLVTAVASGAGFVWLSLRTLQLDTNAPSRLIAELRLAQIGALLLAFVAGSYIGFAGVASTAAGGGLDIALALGFFVVAASAPTRDPREALIILATAFVAHAVVDILHRPGALSVGIVPQWYLIGCAVYNIAIGALCYLPVLRRS
ncbi:MAG: hypothetical protein VYA90_05545 [Acidobacteriota bacterium]|nr:hypothetical protein [Acidobacteriota bacterium]